MKRDATGKADGGRSPLPLRDNIPACDNLSARGREIMARTFRRTSPGVGARETAQASSPHGTALARQLTRGVTPLAASRLRTRPPISF